MSSQIDGQALLLRVMTTNDLDQVTSIERASYAAGWPATAFAHELEHNALARYVVLEQVGEIIGFGGVWLLADQAHIVTVAVKPEERRRGYGRLLVHRLIELARGAGMDSATLEVRVSNAAARSLYRSYGFYEVGERKRYYSDNGEDAIIMTTEALESAAYLERLARLRRALPPASGW